MNTKKPNPEDLVRVALEVEPSLRRDVKVFCAKRGVSVSAWARDLFAREVRSKAPRRQSA